MSIKLWQPVAALAIENFLKNGNKDFIFSFSPGKYTLEYFENIKDSFIPIEDIKGDIKIILDYLNLIDIVGTRVIDDEIIGIELNSCIDSLEAIISHLKSRPYLTIGLDDFLRYKPFMSVYEGIMKIPNIKNTKFIYIDDFNTIFNLEKGQYLIIEKVKYPFDIFEPFYLKV